ncbi:hypothetical protein [Bradyrhizobium roseum]|uniref:hypothetical protein n=1 Tax=Bradyrhizobium roseum TaxID=3056648 RepID=UPI00261DA3BC|nr:hypothetical protein [Bradyrhizobium roseus]WKA27594.1 hypothetical protein QUH67_29130 [Bradyrhizobium roseus]
MSQERGLTADAAAAGRGFAMITDMASLKKAMEQMDADDVVAAEAAKDRAAKILADARLNFSKLAELIEQRRLLLRPSIVANIKKMDQPEMLSDPAFRAAAASLRREGQSFRQIAEALELNGATGPRHEATALRNEVPYRLEPIGLWPRTQTIAMRIISYPLRHPIRFLTIALLAVLLFNGLRDLTGLGRRVSGYAGGVSAARERWDALTSSVSSFFEKRLTPASKEAAAPPTPATPTPSPSPANPPPSAAPSTGPAVTPAPGPTTTVPPSKPAAKDRRQAAQRRTLEEWVPPEIRRRSRVAGPCIGGIGGCYWGGGHY